MFKQYTYLVFILSITFSLIIGCSGSEPGQVDILPTTPDITINSQVTPDSNPHSLLGMYWVLLDPENSYVEVVPARIQTAHLNIRKLLEEAPCTDCLAISNLQPQGDGTLKLDITLRHPFPGYPVYTVFDMRLIMMWDGSEIWPASGLRTQDPLGTDGYIFNSDGYTTIFNPTDFPQDSGPPIFTYTKGKIASETPPDCTLNSYIDYYTDENRHFFGSGQAHTETWHMRLPSGGPLVLGYAVDCSWEPPVNDPPENIPGDFPDNANKPEPWKLEISQDEDLFDGEGDTANVSVKVFDWQDNWGGAWIECPDLFTGKIQPVDSLVTNDFILYIFEVTNTWGVGEGNYRALVGAYDSTEFEFPWDFTTYDFFYIVVSTTLNEPPVAAAEADTYSVYVGDPVNFTSLSTDPDGLIDIVLYQWDFENDGTWDSEDQDPTWTYQSAGTYNVDHKVTDSGGLWDDLEPDELLEINVYETPDPCCENPPVAIISSDPQTYIETEFTLTSESYDPDPGCEIFLAWDTDNDGDFNDSTDNEVTMIWSDPGIYPVSLLVVDECGLIDETTVQVEVLDPCCEFPPVAVIEGAHDVETGEEITLTNASYQEIFDCGITIEWDLDGDGNFSDSTDEEVTLSWDTGGEHFVSLRATNECGLSDETTVHILVTDPCCETPPVASFQTQYSELHTGLEMQLTSNSYDPDEGCDIIEEWDLDGDGEFDDATGSVIFYSWDYFGTYNVGLRVTDSCGLVDTAFKNIIVRVAVTLDEDKLFKTPEIKYCYMSVTMQAPDAAFAVNPSDTDGPWDFTQLSLENLGHHNVFLPVTHPEVADFAGDFGTIDHFSRSQVSLDGSGNAMYIAERFMDAQDQLQWKGIHETTGEIGSYVFDPPFTMTYPFWIYTSESYSSGIPFVFEYTIDIIGWGEGLVTIPYNGLTDEPCVVLQFQLGYESFLASATALMYQWILDDGTVVASVVTYNSDDVTNFNPSTGEIFGEASFTALFDVGPY